MRTLSDAQERVLRKMRDEKQTVHLCGSFTQSAFFTGDPRDRSVRPVTIHCLARLHCIKSITETGWGWRGQEYQITVLGETILRELDKLQAEAANG